MVYRLAAGGKRSAYKLGGTWRFKRGNLDNWIAIRIGTTAMDGEGAE